MNVKNFKTVYWLISMFLMLLTASQISSAYVIPRIGGGTVMHDVAPMIMPVVDFDGTTITVSLDGNPWTQFTGAARPIMRPLTGTDELDPTAVWYKALNGRAWNWQYGWDSSGFNVDLIPNGSKIWLEVTEQSAGLNTYDRLHSYAAIFGTVPPPPLEQVPSSNRWIWDPTLGMAHNAYTVVPGYGEYHAIYNIYIGNATTGDPTAGYYGTTVRLDWVSIPEPATMTLMGMGIVYLFGSRRNHKTAA